MIVGVPKEIKTREYRVGMTPAIAKAYIDAQHQVLVEKGAGEGAGITDADYEKVGAKIVKGADELWKRAEMIVKVKEPIEPEYKRMQPGQIIYTYFHLAAVPELAKVLLARKIAAVAYETIQPEDGSLPLLKPMVFFAVTLTLIGNLQLFEEPYILVDSEKGVAQSVMTSAIFMYRLAFADGDFGTASAVSWILFLIIAGLTWANSRLFGGGRSA